MKQQFNLGQEVTWTVKEFGQVIITKAIVTEVHSDHYIAETKDGMTLWIDEDTESDFK